MASGKSKGKRSARMAAGTNSETAFVSCRAEACAIAAIPNENRHVWLKGLLSAVRSAKKCLAEERPSKRLTQVHVVKILKKRRAMLLSLQAMFDDNRHAVGAAAYFYLHCAGGQPNFPHWKTLKSEIEACNKAIFLATQDEKLKLPNRGRPKGNANESPGFEKFVLAVMLATYSYGGSFMSGLKKKQGSSKPGDFARLLELLVKRRLLPRKFIPKSSSAFSKIFESGRTLGRRLKRERDQAAEGEQTSRE